MLLYILPGNEQACGVDSSAEDHIADETRVHPSVLSPQAPHAAALGGPALGEWWRVAPES